MTRAQMDARDAALIERLQAGVPLVAQPFLAIGQEVGMGEDEVLARVRRLEEADVIRQIGAIFDTRRLGYQSTLAAFHVPGERLEQVAALVSAHPGVSHNYARPHHYNLWFTLAVPPGGDLASDLAHLAAAAGIGDWLNLPALRVFKIRTHFQVADGDGERAAGSQAAPPASGRGDMPALDAADIPYVRALQTDLPLVPRPFAALAEVAGVDEERLLDRARALEAAGIMRRYAAVVRHRHVGYAANGMVCWAVPEERIEEAGRHAATLQAVSHCYHRPAQPPRWRYTLFTMIHGRSRNEVEAVVAGLAQEIEADEYEVLYSTREFKKERVRYFEEERWS
jgi:siroheme decarboxylase